MMTMRLMLLLVLCTTAGLVSAQENGGYSKGDNLLNAGLGVNSYYSGGIPIGASFEKGITDAISVGPNVDYLSHKYYSAKFTALYFGLRGSYHFNELLNIKNDKIDLYAGLTLGYRTFKWNDIEGTIGGTYGSGIYIGGYAGGKYYFSSGLGVFAELGAIGSTNARLGLALKF